MDTRSILVYILMTKYYPRGIDFLFLCVNEKFSSGIICVMPIFLYFNLQISDRGSFASTFNDATKVT